MSNYAIKSEGLSKRYMLGQTQAIIPGKGFHQYNRLSDTVIQQARAFVNGMRHRIQGTGPRQPAPGATSNEFWALQDVSFEIPHGATVGIIGRNGAGKSTLLKVLSRITEPTLGRVELNGRVASLLEVGTGFHAELTGRENIFLNGAILGMTRSEINRNLEAIVDFAGVSEFLDTPVKRYSSGMYVRLAFAVAAHLEPEILIVDEVLAVGDLEFQKKCLGKMSDVAKSGRTVLFVSHNLAAIQQLCTHGIFLQKGRLMQRGPVSESLDAYLQSVESAANTIVSHTSKTTPEVTVATISVNGSPQDHLSLGVGDRSLDIQVTGTIDKSMRLSLQTRLLDAYGSPIAIASPGFTDGRVEIQNAGTFELGYVIQLPKLNKGLYKLTIELIEPNVNCWYEANESVCLSVDGTPMANGQVFEVSQQLGWMLMDVS